MAVETWVLLRGLGRESGHWLDFPAELKAARPEAQVLLIDLPGVGDNRKAKCPESINGIMEFVRSEVKKQNPQGRLNLLAISLGGMLALEWLHQYPEELSGLVLINTSIKSLSLPWLRLRPQVWPDLLTSFITRDHRVREKQLLEVLVNSPEGREKALSPWVQIAKDRPISLVTVLKQLKSAAVYAPQDKKNVLVPVLILAGLGDRFVDPSCSEAIHQRWGWPIERHPWGGHDLTVDDSKWVLDKLRQWKVTNS